MKIYGHRGAAALAPENTVASFAAAMAAGADGVECDVRRSADGALVLIHDDDVARTTGGAGRVSEMMHEHLQSLGVPSVHEVWDATGGRVIFEIKGTSWDPIDPRGTAAALVAFLGGRDVSSTVISSFDPAVLAVVRESSATISTGLLGAAAFDPASIIEAAVAGSHAICFLADAVVTADAVALAREAGLAVIPWTVNDPARIVLLDGWGVDGVITDDPGTARRVLGR